jgi:hypothetical protein
MIFAKYLCVQQLHNQDILDVRFMHVQETLFFFFRNVRHSNIFFSSEFGSNLMCHNLMRSIILKNVIHQVGTKFWKKVLGSQTSFFFFHRTEKRKKKNDTELIASVP